MERIVRKGLSNVKKLTHRHRDGIGGQERVRGSKKWKLVKGRQKKRSIERMS